MLIICRHVGDMTTLIPGILIFDTMGIQSIFSQNIGLRNFYFNELNKSHITTDFIYVSDVSSTFDYTGFYYANFINYQVISITILRWVIIDDRMEPVDVASKFQSAGNS